MAAERKKPYISIVATSRNDNHGGDMRDRMSVFVRGICDQADRFELPVEVVLVDWNPPEGEPLLKDVLPRPSGKGFASIKYVVVPPEIHNRYRSAEFLKLFQFIGKNVGIRRASADFVLATNVDIIFSDALFQAMVRPDLDKNSFYRANRADVDRKVPYDRTIPEILDWCENNIFQVFGYNSRRPHIFFPASDRLKSNRLLSWGVNLASGTGKKFFPKHARKMYELDLHACGDFTMMHREAWEKIEGYPELDLYSNHIDSLGVILAGAQGYHQVIFPPEQKAYHIYHPSGWGDDMEPADRLRQSETRHALDFGVVWECGMSLMKSGKLLGLNPENWGFRDHAFEEFLLVD